MPPVRYRPRRLPQVRLGPVRAGLTSRAQDRPPGGTSWQRIRHGATVAVPDGAGHFERLTCLHLGHAVAASRRTTTHHALSGATAALAHGLRTHRVPDRPALTAPVTSGTRGTPGHHRTTRALAPDDVVLVDGVPCSSLERTIVDCARDLPPLEALVVVDSALAVLSRIDVFARQAGDATTDDVRRRLRDRLDALPPRSPHVRRARAVIEWAIPWAQSAPETFLRWCLLTWGRRDGVPQLQPFRDGPPVFTDIALPDGRRPDGTRRFLHLEYDGLGKYQAGAAATSAEAMLRERDRERQLLTIGDAVVRFDVRDLRGPRSRERVSRRQGPR